MHAVGVESGRQRVYEVFEGTMVAQRKLSHLHRLHLAASIRAIGLQQRQLSGDYHAFGYGAWVQTQIDANRAVYEYLYVGPRLFFESGLFDYHLIDAWRKIRKFIISTAI